MGDLIREDIIVDLQFNLASPDHGLLKRCLIVLKILGYVLSRSHHSNIIHKLSINHALYFTKEVIQIFSKYIHPIHEEAEEKFIFNPCIHAGYRVDEVKELWNQHHIGKNITTYISKKLKKDHVSSRDCKKLAKLIDILVRMYEYHEAIEDTDIFPGFYEIANRSTYQRKLYEDYVGKGRDLYESCLSLITQIEYQIGLSLKSVSPSETSLKDIGVKPQKHQSDSC